MYRFKYLINYDSGKYEWISENGYSLDQGNYISHWDRTPYVIENIIQEDVERAAEYSWFEDDIESTIIGW